MTKFAAASSLGCGGVAPQSQAASARREVSRSAAGSLLVPTEFSGVPACLPGATDTPS